MNQRASYIDNIRVVLTVMVILHHTAITYGAPGGWYYAEPVDGLASGLLLTVFVASNQAYFMGFFFFLSSYFLPASYARKGSGQFILDRFKRLGIPIIFYVLILSPLAIYLLVTLKEGKSVSFFDSFTHVDWMKIGVLWFTAALLLFTTVYWLVQHLPARNTAKSIPLPGNKTIFVVALLLGMVSFAVRIKFPIGWTLEPFGFQLAHFTQYITLFVIGIMAYRNNWLASILYSQGKQWLRVALVLIFIGFPGIYLIKILTHCEMNAFLGGFTLQSFFNAVWEQLLGVALIMAWLGIAKYKWNTQTNLMKSLSRSAYVVYIIHPVILVFIALLFKDVHLASLLKFAITGTLAVCLSFATGFVLVRIPLVKEIV